MQNIVVIIHNITDMRTYLLFFFYLFNIVMYHWGFAAVIIF